ncbi:MAG: hypothetical protein NZ941_04130, partial [Candidatus Caldarchaeum sp.]|nr:hypothetical protein [Candidatus Caldarchaeum sp.]
TNDGSNDYYYFEINDLTQNGNDRFYLLFDNAHDGAVAACGPGIPVEDAIGYVEPPPRPLPSPLIDVHYCGQPTTDQPPAGIDGSQHITSALSFTPGVGYRFEFSHPLNSGDPQDYALSIGSTVGWCIYWRDADKPAPNIVEYPPDCYSVYATGGGASLYGHVVKVGEQPPPGTTVTTTRTTTVTTTSLITTTLTATRTTTAVTTSVSVTTTTVTRLVNATPATTTIITTVVSPTTVTTRVETTLTTTGTVTTTRTTETVSTVTSATTRTLETITTATTTSIVVDPMLENKLYVVIALLLAIIGLIFWLYWNCCKKKGPAPSLPPPGEGPPQPQQVTTVKSTKSKNFDNRIPSPPSSGEEPSQPQQVTTVKSIKSNSDNRSGLGEGTAEQKMDDDVATEGLRSKSVSHKRRFRVEVDWQTSSVSGQARQALNDALQGLDAFKRDISEAFPSQAETMRRNWNNSKANLYRYGQMLTDPKAQQEVDEALRCLDESYQQW